MAMPQPSRFLISAFLLLLGGPYHSSCQVRECECVDYWLCQEGRIVTDGRNLVDVRQKVCPGVMVCCLPPDEETSPEPPITRSPNPETTQNPSPGQDPPQLPEVAGGGGCGRRRFPPTLTNVFKVTSATGEGVPEQTFYGEAPWMVVVLTRSQNQRTLVFKCGGTLITPSVVLTAAHCLENATASQIQVSAGVFDKRIPNLPLPSQTLSARRLVSHPQYNPDNLFNDVGLIFLEGQMELNVIVDIVCGPQAGEEVNPKGCFVTGWGRNASAGRYQSTLSKVNLEMRDRSYCQDLLRTSRLGRHFRLHEGFICAGGGDRRDTCTGDGGGPLVCPSATDGNKLVQMGIVSWGIGCGDGFPTVFASVQHYIAWISSQIS